ncbi:MAG TPA: gliding motility-associated C-terminal domain-containing protein [Bacteroidales bacterium]|nr:gliding motility-associated C-terminal domain-containing protein [Bacteroidales bacterium]
MSKKIQIALVIFLIFAGISGVKAQTNSNILIHNIHYYSYDQDMWGAGGAFNLDFDYELFHLEFSENPTLDFIEDVPLLGPVGIAWEAGFWAYLSSTFSIHGFTLGSIDVNYPVEITLDFPDHYSFDHGETVTVFTSYEVEDGWYLDTHFPTVGIIALDLEYGFGVYMNIIVCMFDCETIPILPTLSIPIDPDYTDPLPHDSIAIFYLNGYTGEVVYPCIDEITGLPMLCEDDILPIVIPDWFGIGLTGEIDLPYVETEDYLDPDTQCLTAYGQDEWIWFNLNILTFLSWIAGFIPPPEGPAIQEIIGIINGGTITYEIMPGVNAIIDYYLLHLDLHMSSYMTQEFSFCPTIWVTLGFPTPLVYSVVDPDNGNTVVDQGTAQDITFEVNNDLNITYPCYDWDSMPVTVAYHFDNDFNNHTWDSIAFDFIVSVFYAHVTIPFDFPIKSAEMPEFELPPIVQEYKDVGYSQTLRYASPEINIISPPQIDLTSQKSSNVIPEPEIKSDSMPLKDIEFEIGPLFEQSFPLGYIPLTWYDQTWEMEGFLLDTVCPGTWLYPLPELDMDINAQDVLCFGDTSGVITVTAIFSSGPFTFTYSWGSEHTHMSPIDSLIVPSGYYFVTVTDVYGCSVSGEINIADAFPPIVTYLHADDVLCAGEPTGNLYSYVTGGAPPYTYLWEPSGSTDPNPVGVYAGWHYLTVTDSVGCTHLDSVFIDEPDEPLEMTWEYGNVTCYGYTNGFIDLTVTGGTPPYYYYWSNNQMTEDLYNLADGAYTITLVDSHGCDIEHTFVIIMPPPLEVELIIQDVLCYGENTGWVNAVVTGGTPPYTYLWSNGATVQDLFNQYAGIYSITVTDANDCEAYAIGRIDQPDLPLTAYIDPTDVRCFGEENGIADLTVFGGTPPYYYAWSNGEISEDILDLEPGMYSVTVFDENDCVAYAQVQIYQSEAPMAGTITGTNVRCNGGSDGNVYINVTGGTPPYHYAWSNGSWEEDQFNVEAGIYRVTVTDDRYCHYIMSYEVTEPEPYVIETYPDPQICYGMIATLGLNLVTGNTPPYVVLWSNGATGMTTNVHPLSDSTFTVMVVDSNNCVSNTLPITVHVYDPIAMTVDAESEHVCPGEFVDFDVNISGGGVSGNYVMINDSMYYLPISLQVFNDTTFEFVIFDSCNYQFVRIEKEITTYPLPPLSISADKYNGCAPLTVSFRENSEDIGQRYIWNFDDGDFENLSFDKYPVHTFFNATTYHVRLEITSAEGCKRDSTIGIVVFPVPEAEFVSSSTSVHMASPAVSFTNFTEGGFFFNWDFGDGTSTTVTNPQHEFSFPGVYHVTLSTESLYGCVDSTGVDITVTNETMIYAPTAFTPNHDLINETFRIIGDGIDRQTFQMEIYNRWGERIFVTNDYEVGWDGMSHDKECPEGIYTWIISFEDPFGNIYTQSGQLSLLR